MKISIFGTGYVGLVTGTCLSELGNEVVCVDIDEEKVNRLNRVRYRTMNQVLKLWC